MQLTEYDKQRREELQAMRERGNLDKDMKPYLQWLNGKRSPEKQYPNFYALSEWIRKSGLKVSGIVEMLDGELGRASIYKLRNRNWGSVSETKAKICLEKLTKEIDKNLA